MVPSPHGNASEVLLVCGSGIVGASFCDGLCAIDCACGDDRIHV